MSKSVIYIGAGVGGVIGSVLGAWIDQGNYLGLWSIFLGLVGGLAGIWVSFKIQR